MGNQDSKSQGGQDFKSYMDRFIDKGKVNDKLYGEGKLVQSKATKATMFVKEYTTNDESSFKQQMKKFEERCKLKHPNLVELQGYTYQSEPQFCSTIYKTYLLFEYCTKSLENDVNNRKIDSSRQYNVDEMWRMLHSYVSGLAFLQSKKLVHGDIKLSNLFISQPGDYKIAEQGMLNPNSSFAQIISTNSKDHKGIYLSPLLLKGVENMTLRPKHNIYRSDVFSLGVCMISAGLLESCDDIYNFNKYIITEMALEEKLEKLKIIFPLELIYIIQQMVLIDEKNRPDFVLLEKLIEDQKKIYTEKISNVVVSNKQEEIANNNNYNTQLIYSTNYQEEKPNYYKEPTPVATFKPESHHSSPQFEGSQYQMKYTSEHNPEILPYNYSEPIDLQKPNIIVSQHQEEGVKKSGVENQINYQPIIISHHHEEGVKRSVNNPIISSNIDNKETTINRTDISVSSKPIENSMQFQENNYRSVADYPINYDDINSLLRKYGIEPLQPLQSNQSPVKSFEKESVMATNYNVQPSQTYYGQPNQTSVQSSQNFVQPSQNLGQSSQNYVQPSQSFQNYSYSNNQTPKIEQFVEKPTINQNYVEEKPPVFANQEFINPQYQNYSAILKNYEDHPAMQRERPEKAKRGSQNDDDDYKKNAGFNIQPNQYEYNRNEYKPVVMQNADNFNSSYDFTSNYNRPSDMMGGPSNNNNFYQNFGGIQTRVVEPSLNQPHQEVTKKNPPSLYENVSFAHEFFETKTTPNDMKHEEYKKKNSISEMKKSINNPDIKENVIENYQNGAKYEGEKLRGMRHGKGRFYYSDGGVYDGEWKENRMYGKGTLYYGSGKIAYEGDWIEDKFEGQGVLYNESPIVLNEMFDFRDFDNIEEFWVKYEGGFHNDNKEGYGVLYLTNNEKFVGYFKEDNMEGRGMFYKANGELVSGMWRGNKFEE